jgi:hypothetical protein
MSVRPQALPGTVDPLVRPMATSAMLPIWHFKG